MFRVFKKYYLGTSQTGGTQNRTQDRLIKEYALNHNILKLEEPAMVGLGFRVLGLRV